MKAPAFWFNPPGKPGFLGRALGPLARLWLLGGRLRAGRSAPFRAAVPVLCVGNLTAGGAGKTPMVTALMERLSALGISAHVVTRGYGGRTEGPHLVDPTEDTATDVGDEPLLLAARGLVWVARDRAAGVRAAVEAGAKLILLDDGFQNPALHKDASILMIDAVQGFGNGRVIPAGPLREPVPEGLSRADLVVLVGPASQRQAVLSQWPELHDKICIGAELKPLQTGMMLEDEEVIAFAGLARPGKFFETLRGLGARLVATYPFPDHHPYSPSIIRRMISEARGRNAILVTTEKDAVRLPPDLRGEVLTVMVRLEPEDWSPIESLISRLDKNSPQSDGIVWE